MVDGSWADAWSGVSGRDLAASMERFKAGLQSLVPPPPPPSSSNGSGFSPDQAAITLIRRPPGRVVSLLTCSKICAVSFAVGVVVGFTLKRRLRRWVTKVLKRLKDD